MIGITPPPTRDPYLTEKEVKERGRIRREQEQAKGQLAQAHGVFGFNSVPSGIGHPRFYRLLDEMRAIHDAKNSDYADTELSGDPLRNFRECQRGGVSPIDGIFTRMSDKWSRLATLFRKRKDSATPAVVEESIQDTLIDLANYALLTIILLEEEER